MPAGAVSLASTEALAEAALSGREAEARVPIGAGELARVAVPVAGSRGETRGAVIVSTLSSMLTLTLLIAVVR